MDVIRKLDQRTLRGVHATIRQDCMALVDHVDVDIDHDDLGKITISAPSLMAQLRDAVVNGRDSVVGARRSKDRPLVLSVAAHDLLERISTETRTKGLVEGATAEERIIKSAAQACRCSTEDLYLAFDYALRQSRWVRAINDLFDPPNRMHISAPCPNCERTQAKLWHIGDHEDATIVPALQIMKSPEGTICKCLGCGMEWPESRFLLLAKAIGC